MWNLMLMDNKNGGHSINFPAFQEEKQNGWHWNKDFITKIKWKQSSYANIAAIYCPFQCNGYICICSKELQKLKYPINNLLLFQDRWPQYWLFCIHLPFSIKEKHSLLDQRCKGLPSPPPPHHFAHTSHKVTWSSGARNLNYFCR